MKRLLPILMLCLAGGALADDETRNVQQALKDQGFYYGEVDGRTGEETAAAIRRFQIRNGLKVTGTLTEETLEAIDDGPEPAPSQQSPASLPPQGASSPAPAAVVQSDQEFLERDASTIEPIPPAPPPPAVKEWQSDQADETEIEPRPPVEPLSASMLFRDTPYEHAPASAQMQALRRAQIMLHREGYYRGPIDGIFGSGTDRAIRTFQNDSGLVITGRLDAPTLRLLRLLPSRYVVPRRDAPGPRYYDVPPPERPAVRGIWVR